MARQGHLLSSLTHGSLDGLSFSWALRPRASVSLELLDKDQPQLFATGLSSGQITPGTLLLQSERVRRPESVRASTRHPSAPPNLRRTAHGCCPSLFTRSRSAGPVHAHTEVTARGDERQEAGPLGATLEAAGHGSLGSVPPVPLLIRLCHLILFPHFVSSVQPRPQLHGSRRNAPSFVWNTTH